jgi:hypothetical protein
MDLDGRAVRAIESVGRPLEDSFGFEAVLLLYLAVPLLIGVVLGLARGPKAPTRRLIIAGSIIALPSTLMIASLGFFTLPFGLVLLAVALGSRLRRHAEDFTRESARAP